MVIVLILIILLGLPIMGILLFTEISWWWMDKLHDDPAPKKYPDWYMKR